MGWMKYSSMAWRLKAGDVDWEKILDMGKSIDEIDGIEEID
jgi:hypothetical protein